MSDAESWKAKGNAAIVSKQFQEAIDCYTKAIELDASNHVYFSNRSAAYLSSGDAESALADADECIKLNPKFAKGYSRKGAALHALNKFNEAIDAYEEGLKIEPGNQGLQSGLQSVQDAQLGGSFGMSQIFGDNALSKLAGHPQFSKYLADESFMNAFRMVQKDPNALGTAMQTDKRIMEVLGFLLGMPSGAGGENPFSPEAAARHEEEERKRKEEEEEARKKQEEERKRREEEERRKNETPEEREKREKQEAAVAKKEEGNALYKQKKFEEAIVRYEEAADLDPEDITYRLNKAAVLLQMGKTEECIDVCKKAIEYAREIFAPLKMVAKAYARIGNAYYKEKNWGAAIEAFESSLAESHDPEVYNKKRKAIQLKKKEDEESYKDPVKAEEAKARGNDHFKAGEFPKAIEEYTEAIKRNPDNAVYYANRAAALTKIMDFNAALEDCDKALSLDANYVKAYIRKGAVHFFRKEFHKAMEAYERGMKIAPDNEELKTGLQRTVLKINESANSGEVDKERAARAMQDPEIQNILSDPMVHETLRAVQTNPAVLQEALRDPSMAAKLQRLIAAGVLQIGGGGGGAAAH